MLNLLVAIVGIGSGMIALLLFLKRSTKASRNKLHEKSEIINKIDILYAAYDDYKRKKDLQESSTLEKEKLKPLQVESLVISAAFDVTDLRGEFASLKTNFKNLEERVDELKVNNLDQKRRYEDLAVLIYHYLGSTSKSQTYEDSLKRLHSE